LVFRPRLMKVMRKNTNRWREWKLAVANCWSFMVTNVDILVNFNKRLKKKKKKKTEKTSLIDKFYGSWYILVLLDWWAIRRWKMGGLLLIRGCKKCIRWSIPLCPEKRIRESILEGLLVGSLCFMLLLDASVLLYVYIVWSFRLISTYIMVEHWNNVDIASGMVVLALPFCFSRAAAQGQWQGWLKMMRHNSCTIVV
jgi:hypothetical protein